MFDRRIQKKRKKNFSFRRFLLNSMFFVLSRVCDVIPSEGPKDRSRGICLCQQTSRLPLEVTESMLEETGRAGPSADARDEKEEWKRQRMRFR